MILIDLSELSKWLIDPIDLSDPSIQVSYVIRIGLVIQVIWVLSDQSDLSKYVIRVI